MAKVSSFLARAGLVALALSIAGAVGPAFAASGGSSSGGGSGGGSGSGASTPSCPTGYVYDSNKKSCVRANSGLFDDKQLYAQGRALALAGRYAEALGALTAVRNQNDSMVLTMIGYAKRKSGSFDEGMAYYRRALAIDPKNVNTREYLGEAYAEKGRMDLAKAELVKVEALCGTECEQYQDLAKAIAGQSDE
jgi:tetratricopeptide (TPR) repeat protein